MSFNDSCLRAARLPFASLLLLAVGAAGLAGCAQPVRVDGQWHDEALRGQSFSRILVVAVSPHPDRRCTFERQLAAQIRTETTHVMSSCSALPEGVVPQRENIEQVVAERGVDAVLVTSLVAASQRVQEGGTSETRGEYYFQADDVGYAWNYYDWGYYGVHRTYGGPVVYGHFETAPPLNTVEGEISVVSRLIETGKGSLVYETHVRAKELHSTVEALATITPEIAGQLRKAGLVR